MDILEEFNYYAGYKLNITKTQLLSFNYKPSEEIKHKHDLIWNMDMYMEEIKYLGVIITKSLNRLYEANYKLINQNIKKDIE